MRPIFFTSERIPASTQRASAPLSIAAWANSAPQGIIFTHTCFIFFTHLPPGSSRQLFQSVFDRYVVVHQFGNGLDNFLRVPMLESIPPDGNARTSGFYGTFDHFQDVRVRFHLLPSGNDYGDKTSLHHLPETFRRSGIRYLHNVCS